MTRHTWRVAVTACAAGALLAGPMALGSTAAPSDPGSVRPDQLGIAPKVDPGIARALERDLGISRSDAGSRLTFQARASSIRDDLAQRLGATYAGAWVDPTKNVMYVGVADGTAAAAVRAAGARAVVVDHTLAELEQWQASLDAARLDAPDQVPSWYVDVTTNSVVVSVRPGGEVAAQDLVARAGVPAGSVTFEATEEAPRTFIDIVGGNAYTIGGTSRCSVGFAVTGGFVSAGHCGRVGATTASPSGTFRGSSFPGNDYAWVAAASGNTPVGAVNRYDGTRVSVAGSTDAAVGAAVCRSGSTTGWRCGTIQSRGASVTYAQGTVSGLIRTNVCAEPGDSGGSLIAGNQAQGVTSGGSGNCSSGGTTYFQPVNEILSAYGLTLITGGGGTTPPPTTACSGYASSYQGTLSSGAAVAQPSGGSVTVSRSGTIRLCLAGPSGADFDLYLQKRSGSTWSTVAQGTTSSANEAITYSGTAGTYRYVVLAYSGSGSYVLGATTP
ncbi:S1 family peptidase [Cellulomonas fengjieae]|uniref:S1 family peptidase n=1 Tax=Cellulomonas fengjieae TaxID=2819978 RepID=UPI001AAE8DA1|nr:S1 family peptidase [Cellulomonas fengjieae]MBO3103610.1 S1 family peptidase [Cellulomonas fengjieae]